MRASEWQFLCAVHESPKSCCAIDYCCHTLDWATNIVTSQKIFPSRLSLAAGDGIDDRGAGVKHLINIFRRLHRIFAHAWFQHRGVFWQVEGQTGLYVLFKTVCDTYELLPAENYKLPPEAEGLEPVEEVRAAAPTVLKAQAREKTATKEESLSSVEEDFISVGRTNTRRHIRQSPSVGSAVTTVLEADEEDPDVTQKLGELSLAEEEAEVDAEGGTEVPVIVETYEVEENQETSPEQQESGPAAPIKAETTAQDESTVTSATSSWDTMSSESLEKAEEPKETEPTAEEAKPKVKEVEATPESETKEPSTEELPEKEETTSEEVKEETKADES